jgi:hypothetical protein
MITYILLKRKLDIKVYGMGRKQNSFNDIEEVYFK